MEWARSLGLAVALAAALVGCGGRAKINHAKLDAVHKVAVVGVCAPDSFLGAAGLSGVSFQAPWGRAIVPHMTTGFERALPGALRGVDIVPLTTVAANPAAVKLGAWARPEPSAFARTMGNGRTVCAAKIDPLEEGNGPDLARMKQLAEALGVDAVLAVHSKLVVESGSSKATVKAATAVAYLVDKNGDLVVKASLKGAESGEIEKLFRAGLATTEVRDVSDAELEQLGKSLGEALGARFTTLMTGG
jgi:hypothetical protein